MDAQYSNTNNWIKELNVEMCTALESLNKIMKKTQMYTDPSNKECVLKTVQAHRVRTKLKKGVFIERPESETCLVRYNRSFISLKETWFVCLDD